MKTTKKARLKQGCISLIGVFTLIITGAFTYWLLGIPTELAWLWWLFIIVCGAIGGWLANQKLKGNMEKKLGRKLQGKHELSSLKSWMDASEDETKKSK